MKKYTGKRVYLRREPEQLRQQVIKLRCTIEESERILQSALRSGMPVSVYCREVALSKEVKPVKNMERWGNLGRLGTELVKTRELLVQGDACDVRVLDLIVEILSELKKLREEL